jgi:hypothetical protein
LSGSGLDDWRTEIPNLTAEVGQRRLSNHLYLSSENSMTFNRRNRRGIFGTADERGCMRMKLRYPRLNKYFSKIETVIELKTCSNSPRRRHTEITARIAATDFRSEASCSVEFRTKYFVRRKIL